jgi:hypothetical protein
MIEQYPMLQASSKVASMLSCLGTTRAVAVAANAVINSDDPLILTRVVDARLGISCAANRHVSGVLGALILYFDSGLCQKSPPLAAICVRVYVFEKVLTASLERVIGCPYEKPVNIGHD